MLDYSVIIQSSQIYVGSIIRKFWFVSAKIFLGFKNFGKSFQYLDDLTFQTEDSLRSLTVINTESE